MNTFLFGLISIVTVSFTSYGVTGDLGQTMQCQTYAALGQKGYSCNDLPDVICQAGCNAFVTASNCSFPDHPKKPATNELCTVGFGRDTAAAKACLTGQGTFRCVGPSTGKATCHGCVKSNQINWL